MTESDTQSQPHPDANSPGYAWDAEVPEWMIKRDEQMALRRQTARRLSEMQWSLLCLATTTLISVLSVRLALLPPPPPPAQSLALQMPAPTPPVDATRATPLPEPSPVKAEPPLLAAETPLAMDAAPPASLSPPSTPYPAAPAAQAAPLAPTGDRRAEREVTATDLVREYQASRLHAEERYNTKIISVTGTVKARGRDIQKHPFIALAADGSDLSVRCIFDGKQQPDPEQVELGQQVTVRGICGGAFVDIALTECDLR